MITQSYKINLIPDGIPTRIPVSQFDTGRTLQLKLWNGTLPFEIPNDAVVTMDGTKPDGRSFSYETTTNENTATVQVTEQMTAVNGEVECQLTVVREDGRILSSSAFLLIVERDVLGENGDLSESELSSIRQLIAGSAENAASAQNAAKEAAEQAAKAEKSAETVEKNTEAAINETLAKMEETATEIVHKSLKDSIPTNGARTDIPENSNLDNYKTIGNFACMNNTNAESLTNCPVKEAFRLDVYNCIGTETTTIDGSSWEYFIQELTTINGEKWIRALFSDSSGNTWAGAWSSQSGSTYITETSTTVGWTYRKYSDGTVDLWYQKEISSMAVTTAGSGYKTAEIAIDAMPFTVNNPVKSMHFTPSTAYVAWPVELQNGNVELHRNNSGSVAGTLQITVHGMCS